ncbi:hypothetical protein H257_15687 [Aphanomyces astaci]|uniref:Peptidase A2 domain-containing protein n=1 Tax=Aphanomyces astaci TaxID=112090 RepID=W4FN62_APHAT|nr:hypothetical protein H257_15687 [Aphanomyces astaci]ETV68366.1 hypothetical protein H257_15687 [Aphanomyces astaci]|eukprot:XP_009842161.1 hypothetical protein H257_15687 [Aphanomyces astaci]
MSIPDADSRIGRMLDGMAAALRRDRQEWVIREESAAIVKIITEAVKPVSLHRTVTEQMALTRNKPLRKDVPRAFMKKKRSRPGSLTRRGCRKEAAKDLGQLQRRRNREWPRHHLRLRHRLEAVRLLKAHGQKRGDWSPTMRTNAVKVGREDLTATVDGVVPVRASLLDSGADLSVASAGLVSALLATTGASPEIIVMGPTTLRPYGTDSRPITVTKQVRLGRLEFNTGCGPLMLRGLRVWIDEAEAAVELTLGLPVMQKLGYSEQTLLENARRQQAV